MPTAIGSNANSSPTPVGCGFITCALAERPASLDVALAHHPAAIMLSFGDLTFGDPTPFLPRIKGAGALVICQVQTLAQARAVLAEGADILPRIVAGQRRRREIRRDEDHGWWGPIPGETDAGRRRPSRFG